MMVKRTFIVRSWQVVSSTQAKLQISINQELGTDLKITNDL
jgi:hypothetical protein